MIKRFFDEQNVPYLRIFKMATDERPFFTQLYGKRKKIKKIAADKNSKKIKKIAAAGSCLGYYEPTEE